ncbi:hypothetical protein C4J96_2503 [Pseudomonas orientalis]|nr:hypothetical protein C4J96_2503 [Pseudomonas orientalis]
MCGFVVGVHREFHAVQVHPVVGHVQRGRQQLRTDALALPRRRHAHAERPHMRLAHAQVLFQPQLANHFAAVQRHQLQSAFVIHHQAFAPSFHRLERHLQYLTAYGRFVIERRDALKVGLGEALNHDMGVRHVHCVSSFERQVADQCRSKVVALASP